MAKWRPVLIYLASPLSWFHKLSHPPYIKQSCQHCKVSAILTLPVDAQETWVTCWSPRANTQTSSVDPTSRALSITPLRGAVGSSGNLKDMLRGSKLWGRTGRLGVASQGKGQNPVETTLAKRSHLLTERGQRGGGQGEQWDDQYHSISVLDAFQSRKTPQGCRGSGGLRSIPNCCFQMSLQMEKMSA